MNKDIQARWIEALESGRYKQGRGALRSANDEYCCLGVLCDVMAPDRWTPPTEIDGRFQHLDEHNTGVLPTCLRRESGLTPGAHGNLMEMNDGKGKTFAEIAEYIKTL